ncbi:MAG: PIN domain-containing protein [Potamolinea sp.]
MKIVFADAFYWIALINPGDDWHLAVRKISLTLYPATLITTEEVLTETLNFYASKGTQNRRRAFNALQSTFANPLIQVIPQTHESFQSGMELYQARLDKGYSLTDCISMQTMRQLGITEVLTHDRHFTQEGFVILLTT